MNFSKFTSFLALTATTVLGINAAELAPGIYSGPTAYYLINQETGTVVTLWGGSPAEGTEINASPQKPGNLNTIWQIATADTSGNVLLINPSTGSFAQCPQTLGGYSYFLGGQYPITNETLFSVVKNPDNSVQFKPLWASQGNSTYCMDLADSNPANGTRIICYPCHYGTGYNQNWNLVFA